jgi:hypothetical protein
MGAGPYAYTYILPLRWNDGRRRQELTEYLRDLCEWGAETIVVDGSPSPVFGQNRAAWMSYALHVPPDPVHDCLNGKVAAVLTGVDRAAHERIILADDDVRYDPVTLNRALAGLDDHDLLRPQNYFVPVPWHARWDTARILINRAVGADYPGTLALRRSCILALGGYAGDVLFENLELIRTFVANGHSCESQLDLYVRRLPPTAAHFRGQRIRQAYDEFATPVRMSLWLSIIPVLLTAAMRRNVRALFGSAIGVIGVAERGRRRAGGAQIFPVTSSILAPGWVLERGVCSWLAVVLRVQGGVSYHGNTIRTAAHSLRALRNLGGFQLK